MAKPGSAATIFLASSRFSGPSWKFSMRSCSSDSSFLASDDFVVHSKRPPAAASAWAAEAPGGGGRAGRVGLRLGQGQEPRVGLAVHADFHSPRLLLLDPDRIRGTRLSVDAEAGGQAGPGRQAAAGPVRHHLLHARKHGG